MRGSIIAAAFAAPVLGTIPAAAQMATQPDDRLAAGPERIAQRFFETLKAGKAREAVVEIFATAPIDTLKEAQRLALVEQIDAAAKVYGPVITWELLGSETLGTLMRRDTYLVQHRGFVLRWRFVYARTPAGWGIVHYGFEDQVQTWFD